LGAGYRAVSDGYFEAIGVPVLAGRSFGPMDDLGTQRVALINQSMADAFWPGQNPIGRRVRAPSMESLPDGPEPAWLTIIGVVGNVRHFGPDTEIQPEMYTSYRQVPYYGLSMTAVIHTSSRADRLIPAVQAALRELDPDTPADLSTQEQRLAEHLLWRSVLLGVLSGFALVALLLAALGIYSLLSFAVAQRTRELAVRAALGARRSNLLRLVLSQAMTVVLLGSAAGLLAALALTRLLTAFLVDTSPLDPLTFAAVTTFLIAVAAMAAALPALRATRLDPLVALQSD
jgi:putative ABC transport system permease protein